MHVKGTKAGLIKAPVKEPGDATSPVPSTKKPKESTISIKTPTQEDKAQRKTGMINNSIP